MPPPIAPAARLRAALDALADACEELRFGLEVAARPSRLRRGQRLVALLRRYLVPRLGDPEAPLLVVVFGPTGGGKSTLVNSLAGRTISRAGSLRPTTTDPVVWCHRHQAHRYRDLGAVIVPDDNPLVVRLTLIDTPDLDSYLEEHRVVSESILGLADVGLFVTTPQRYADAVPWEVVSESVERDQPLMVVANRLSRRTAGAVVDLADLLRRHGLDGARVDDIFQVQEHRLRGEGLLPKAAVSRVRARLEAMVANPQPVVAAAVRGAVHHALVEAAALAQAVRAQASEADALWQAARLGYRHQAEEIVQHLESGDLVRSQVVARWQRLVGVTDLAAMIARGFARVRDLVGTGAPVATRQVEQVGHEVRQELVDLVVARCHRAVRAAVSAWELERAGRALLGPELRAPGPELEGRVLDQVDEWLAVLVAMVGEQGKARFRVARAASIGINAAATLLLIGVFAQTGGLTGAEVGVVAGTAAAQQTVLERLFGKASASRLARRARADLAERLGRVLEADAERFRRAIDAVVDPRSSAERLEEASRAVRGEMEALGVG